MSDVKQDAAVRYLGDGRHGNSQSNALQQSRDLNS